MKHSIFLIAKREYIKIVRKPTFWIATLALPLFMIIITIISAYSAKSFDSKIKEDAKQTKTILVIDESGYINKAAFDQPPFQAATSLDTAIEQVKQDKANAVFLYHKDIAETGNITIHGVNKGFFSDAQYNTLATELLKQSILSDIKDQNKLKTFNSKYNLDVTTYKNGEKVTLGFERFIIPIVSIAIYFLMVTSAAGFMLLSVSEEKENRMIETILSMITAKELITGKLIGQVGVVFTQLGFIVTSGILIALVAGTKLPFDIAFQNINFDITQILAGIYFTFAGFLILAHIMVGVGAAVPTYKEAQSFSSVFIIMSIMPVYFATLLLADPSGTVAKILSYFPLSAPMVLIFRNSLGELSKTELLISMLVIAVYVYGTLKIAFKLFEIGSLEYNKKISLRTLFQKR